MSITVAEFNELVGWMKAAFERYAEQFAHSAFVCEPNETPEQCRARILHYGAEFSRILRGSADYHVKPPKLLDDLFDLKKRACPPQNIVEFMLACTNWFGADLSKFEEAFEIPERLDSVSMNCRQMAEDIETLSLPLFYRSPYNFLREQFPNRRERCRVRRLIDSLPEALRCMEKLLEKCAPAPVSKPVLRSAVEAYSYGLLYFFHHDHHTLSDLLEAMRAIRSTVSPDTVYVRNIEPIRIRSGKYKGEEKDPLSADAILKRVTRLFEKDSGFMEGIMLDVSQYMGDAYAEHRSRGDTLMSLLLELEKDREQEATPPLATRQET